MPELAGFPYWEVEFNKRGLVESQSQVDALLAGVQSSPVSDLVVICHGWNNDAAEARALYTELVTNMRAALDAGAGGGLPGRSLGILGVFWPSKKFTLPQEGPGGAASLAGSVSGSDLETALAGIADTSEHPDAEALAAEAASLLPRIADRPSDQDRLVAIVLQLLQPADTDDDGVDQEVAREWPSALDALQGREVIDRLSRPGLAEMQSGDGGAAGLGTVFGGAREGVLNFLNLTTYYTMKERAGKVGRRGLRKVLQAVLAATPQLRLHTVGHSFGARVVASALRGPDDIAGVTVSSLCLLQAAFSHNGFSVEYDGRHDGYFRRVVSDHKVTGPVAITYTVNDKAVGLAYPLASRLSGDTAAAIGDADDPYGGLGRNGAQHTPEASAGTLLAPGSSYSFTAGVLHNLRADEFIADHGDVRNPAVANMVVQAIA